MAHHDLSQRFIDRPILAGVMSLFIFIVGAIAMFALPISEYPEVAPPQVVVAARYPGANPKVIAETVAAPIEEAINGVEGMLYLSSQSNTDGMVNITVTFALGTDPDLAQQLVQNRVSQATPRLPDVVRALGVTTVKSSPDLTMVVHLYSPSERYDMVYLRNFALLNVKDPLARLQGVGQSEIFGAGDYAIRVWLDPEKMAARRTSAPEVIYAIREQNIQIAAGTIGGQPAAEGVAFELPVNVQGRLKSVEEFEAIVLRADKGAVLRLKDVARVELGASSYSLRSLLNNKPAVAIAIFQAPGSNALSISKNVRETMEKLKADFPEGIDYDIVYDPTRFVEQSIDAVIHTLFEALLLVVLVVVVFLQTWRASLIPLLAVPVSIVGTFAVMLALGFSINALSLFGLVLAIGIVVDDAIVVVENVERNIALGLSPREATYQAMREVSGPIIAIALVLIAVFVPIAFISGLTGQFYKQFALTIAISTVISAFNSLTLSPALAAILLHGHEARKDRLTRLLERIFGYFFAHARWVARACALYIGGTLMGYVLLKIFPAPFRGPPPKGVIYWFIGTSMVATAALAIAGLHLLRTLASSSRRHQVEIGFGAFNRWFERQSTRYGGFVAHTFTRKRRLGLLYVALIALTIWGFARVPMGYVPGQDKQYLVAFAQLPGGASLERSDAVIRRMSDIALKHPGVVSSVAFPGLSIAGFSASPNAGIVFVTLKPFSERKTPDLSAGAIAGALNMAFAEAIDEAFVAIFPPPPVSGMGTIGGFKLEIEDRTDLGYDALNQAVQQVMARAYQTPELMGVFSSFVMDVPQLELTIDRVRAKQQGVALADLFETLQMFLGSYYVNDVNLFGRTFRVYAQADAPYRAKPEDIARLQVKNRAGEMVPLGSLVTVSHTYGPERAMRYNGYRAADINGNAGPGFTSGQAQAAITRILAEVLPKGMAFEWTDLTYQQILAGNTAGLVLPLCVLFVFLVLAAQYESLSLPLAVILIVPLCLFGAIWGVWLLGKENNVFTQIGFIVLVGLACKNAILIVEFARELEYQGRNIAEAALEAARLRLRPILMTSFAFIMGVVPLVKATGAGAEMRADMGVAVFFGMIGVTLFGLMLTPLFYVVIRRMFGGKPLHFAEGVPMRNLLPVSVLLMASACDLAPEMKLPNLEIPAFFLRETPENAAAQKDGARTAIAAPVDPVEVEENFVAIDPAAIGRWKQVDPKDGLEETQWWQMFADEPLNRLMAQAMAENPSLEVALKRLESARAQAGLAEAPLYPDVSVGAGPVRQQSPTASINANLPPGVNVRTKPFTVYNVQGAISYELDLFGKLRNTAKAAAREAEAEAHRYRAARLMLQAELADAYFMQRLLLSEQKAQAQAVQSQTQTLALIRKKHKAGLADDLALSAAESERSRMEGELAALTQQAQANFHRLAVLAGIAPAAFNETFTLLGDAKPPRIPAGMPAALLARRPDVAASLAGIAAANAKIGAARAGYLPDISLSLSGGYSSTEMADLFKKDNQFWMFGPMGAGLGVLTQPIFQGGLLKYTLAAREAGYQQASAAYKQTVLTALQEVEDALAAVRATAQQESHAMRGMKAADRAVQVARKRMKTGYTSHLEWQEAERSHLAASRALNQTRAARQRAAIALVRALGGGW